MPNNKLKDLVLQIRYPYTAAVIATIWIGTAFLVAINRNLPVVQLVVFNAFASVLIALLGFPNPKR